MNKIQNDDMLQESVLDTDHGQSEQDGFADIAIVQEIGERLIKKHLQAFKEPAK